MVNDLVSQFAGDIAASRSMMVGDVRKIIDGAPYGGEEALRLKLIDKMGYYDTMLAAAKRKADIPSGEEKDNTVALHDYELDETPKAGAKIALIIGAGEIVSYSGGIHAGLDGAGMPADKIAAAFEAAHKDANVAAVVFRIDSPGGSPEAAETIRHAIMKTRQNMVETRDGKQVIVRHGKPVIVSMGGYAASGGYWVSAAADKIVAQPGTITGSIGVFGGKFVVTRLWQKLGVHWDSVTSGANAQMFSSNKLFTPAQHAKFEAMLDDIYDAFIQRVASGRRMTPEQVEAVADGRVWTGRQAKAKGLVDELGGLEKAVALAKVAAKIKPEQFVPLRHFPEKKTPFERLFMLLSGEGDEDARVMLRSFLGLDAASIAKSLQAEILNLPEMRVR
jgi:protease-4